MPKTLAERVCIRSCNNSFRAGLMLEEQYGDLLRQPPFSEASTARQLLRLFEERLPQVYVTEACLKYWMEKHLHGSSVQTAQECDETVISFGVSARTCLGLGSVPLPRLNVKHLLISLKFQFVLHVVAGLGTLSRITAPKDLRWTLGMILLADGHVNSKTPSRS